MARNTSVTLGKHFDEFVAEKIKQGRFQSVSEVVRAGLRMLEENECRLAALRAKLEAGEKGPVVKDFDGRDFIHRMHEKHVK